MARYNDSPVLQRPFRVFVGGYINLNVIDGSSFFLAGLCAMLARVPNIEVVLLSANPIQKKEVISEIEVYPNIRIIDPFDESNPYVTGLVPGGKTISRIGYAALAREVLDTEMLDAAIIRDTEIGTMLAETSLAFRGMGCVYLTGIGNTTDEISPRILEAINKLLSLNCKLLLQTHDMLKVLDRSGVVINPDRVAILPPHVPDPPVNKANSRAHETVDGATKFVYAGKFFPDWNTDLILAGFKAVSKEIGNRVTLDVAGNQFREDPHDPYFVNNVKYLLQNTPHVSWHGGLSRSAARQLISKADVGISWRRPTLDKSPELSTKLVEYGALGLPTILNRTEAHEALLGEDYPFFANSISDYKAAIKKASSFPQLREMAGHIAHKAALPYTYSAVLPGLLDFLGNHPGEGGRGIYLPSEQECWLELEGESYRKVEIVGAWMTVFPGSVGRVSWAQATELFLTHRMEYRYWDKFAELKNHSEEVRNLSMGNSLDRLKRLELENEQLKLQLQKINRKLRPIKGIANSLENYSFLRPAVGSLRKIWRAY